MDTQLPEYLRDYTLPEPNEDSPYEEWLFHDVVPLFSKEEIAQQDRDYEDQILTGSPFDHTLHPGYYPTTNEIMEEYDKQEKLGVNSWLNGQPYGPGVSHPSQDRAIRFIKEFGYSNTIREKRPSLIFKSTLNVMKDARVDQQVDVIKALLKKMNLDPSYFVEQVYQYKK